MKKMVYGVVIALGLLLLLSVAVDASDAQDALQTGLRYYDSKDYGEALKWVRKSADQGDAKAQGFLGSMYHSGKGVPQNYREAAKWYRKSANQGNALAQSSLGIMYYEGKGVTQSSTEAAKWIVKAAAQGDKLALKVLQDLKEMGHLE